MWELMITVAKCSQKSLSTNNCILFNEMYRNHCGESVVC